jgi:hypothetical protein
LNQSDIFARGKLEGETAWYWFLLQWDNSTYIPYYTSHSFDYGESKKPEVTGATSKAEIWTRVRGGSTIIVLAEGQEDDGSGKICVSADSTVSVADLQRLLSRGSACTMAQASWNEINRR